MSVAASSCTVPEADESEMKQHIAAWRDGQHERWTRYLLEDLAAIVGGEDRRSAAERPRRTSGDEAEPSEVP